MAHYISCTYSLSLWDEIKITTPKRKDKTDNKRISKLNLIGGYCKENQSLFSDTVSVSA